MLTQQTIREIRRAVKPLGKPKPRDKKKRARVYGNSDLHRFRKVLLVFREDAIRELHSLRESAGTDLPVSEPTTHLIQGQIRLLNQLDAALKRINDETYGVCRSCGKKIEPGRLEAVPHTQMCLSCKAM